VYYLVFIIFGCCCLGIFYCSFVGLSCLVCVVIIRSCVKAAEEKERTILSLTVGVGVGRGGGVGHYALFIRSNLA
jgi:hypothetical protein